MLQKTIQHVFIQLSTTLDQLSNEQYTQHCNRLSNATIGQHVRHIIELFQCLVNNYSDGNVSYDKRKRDTAIENDKAIALRLLDEISAELDRPDKTMLLECTYDEDASPVFINTNYFRELIYNLEHTIHHMALIRVGINEVSFIDLPETFGVAPSTIKYKKLCAQ